MTPETACLIEKSKNEEKINKIENSTTNNYCIKCQKQLNNNLKQQNNNCFIKNIFCLILIIFFIILILIIFILPIIERKNKNYFLTNINGNCLCLEKNSKLNDGKFKNREKRQSFFEMPVEYKTINNEEIKSNRLNNNEEQLEDLNERKTDYSSPLFVPLYAQIPADKLREICLDKFYKEFEKEFECFNSKRRDIINQKQINNDKLNEDNRTLKTNISEQHINTLKRNRKKMRKRKSNNSSTIKWISPPSLINTRFDLKINSAVRHGNRWFMSEYGNSYTLLQFDNYTETTFDSNMDVHFTKKQKDFYYHFLPYSISFPSYIHTISEPFYGTDFTVGGILEMKFSFMKWLQITMKRV
uniref:Uncharacterized protein n=1 Tax=Meloidogyne enterolobii TaxID=390850 RepID=A0A6V7VAG8_MELEN|nr:unnamed protein product [Meloidogyne enterolobii]